MGLDMQLFMIQRKITQQEVFEIKNEELIETMSWRKFITLQDIMNNFWIENNTGRHVEICQEDLVVTKDMLCKAFNSLIRAEYNAFKEDEGLNEWELNIQVTLDIFDILIGEFDFENNTLIYRCSY